eukprot:4713533-Amphidinium_carterae.1
MTKCAVVGVDTWKNLCDGSGLTSMLPRETSLKEKDIKFIQLLALAGKSNKGKVALQARLSQRGKLNQLNLVGFIRWLVELRPWCNDGHMQVALSALAFFDRTGVQADFKVEMGILRPWVDEVLTQHFGKMRRVGMSTS